MPIRRLAAYLLDWGVFAVWAGLVFAVAWLLQRGEPAWPADPWVGQALGFALTTLPFGAYFVAMERSAWQATLGKRALDLRVVGAAGARVSRSRALVRTVGKLLPWELGHTAAHHTLAADRADVEPSAWCLVVASVAIAAAIVYVACLFTTSGRTPYDRLSRTRVERPS